MTPFATTASFFDKVRAVNTVSVSFTWAAGLENVAV
uniref:Uncharacterized protein n=1 Tax=Arundo donax TaxID=35708 RepID=A0A0A9F1W4_ARUDO